MADLTEFEAAFIEGRNSKPAPQVVSEGGIPFAVVPHDMKVVSLDEFTDAPRRKKGRTKLTELASFIAYVNAQKGPATELFMDRVNGNLWAVFDGQATPTPGHGQFQAVHSLQTDPAWAAWLALNGKAITPTALAEHLEVWGDSVADPPAGRLAGLVSNLKISETTSYGRSEVLQNGSVSFAYTREAGAAGELVIPPVISLGLLRWEGEVLADGKKGHLVTARLRYRLNGDKLTFTLMFNRPDEVEREAFTDLRKRVEAETGLLSFEGAPTA